VVFAANENRTGNRKQRPPDDGGDAGRRARGAAAAAARFAREPEVVGAHWFQYYDIRAAGAAMRDYDFGWSRRRDRLTAAGRRARAVNPRLAAFHRAARVRVPSAASRASRAPIDPRDRSLAEWRRNARWSR